MNIQQINLKGLFGIFNHNIPINLEKHITIMHGPNGYGKTVSLKMINAIFNSQYEILRNTPFEEFSIEFDTGSALRVTKKAHENNTQTTNIERTARVVLELNERGKTYEPYVKEPITRKNLRIPPHRIDEYVPDLEQIARELWLHVPTQEQLTIDEVLERFGDYIPYKASGKKKEPAWLKEIKESVTIRLIDTQRLFIFQSTRPYRRFEESPAMIPTVYSYSKELAKAIQERLAEYGTLSQSLDRTFPTRLVKGDKLQELKLDELRGRLRELEDKRARLMGAGLLDKDREIDFSDFQDIDDSNINVLSVYIDDVEQKLDVFDDMYRKLDLLVKIIDKRFLYKDLSISRTDGFVIQTLDGRRLEPSRLSSGEQHELVLLYGLLFKVPRDSLILIDEPEISLHVIWQQQFLRDLQEITKLVGFNVLIATHSPEIIHDRWDLTVELEGPNNEEISDRSSRSE